MFRFTKPVGNNDIIEQGKQKGKKKYNSVT